MLLNTTPHFGVIASMCPNHSHKLLAALPQASKATSLEIRLDGMVESVDLNSFLQKDLPGLLSDSRPIILTMRPRSQGGTFLLPPEEQWQFWNSLPTAVALKIADPLSKVFADWAVDLVRWVIEKGLRLPFPWNKIGISSHFLTYTPADITPIVQELESFPACAFLKFVCFAKEGRDIGTMRSVPKLCSGNTPFIFFPMGALASRERYRCIRDGSWGTFGYVSGLGTTAPGQVSIEELFRSRGLKRDLRMRGLLN